MRLDRNDLFILPIWCMACLSFVGSACHIFLQFKIHLDLKESYFFLLSLLTFLATSVIWLRRNRTLPLDFETSLWFGLLFFSAFGYGLLRSQNYSFWLDEWISYRLKCDTIGPVHCGIENHQPPAFYALVVLVKAIFPPNALLFRLPICLAGAWSAGLVFLLASRKSVPRWFAMLFAVVFFCIP